MENEFDMWGTRYLRIVQQHSIYQPPSPFSNEWLMYRLQGTWLNSYKTQFVLVLKQQGMYTGLKNPSCSCLQPFFFLITPLCSIPGKSFIYPQREQGLPQGSITLLTEHILEALFRSWKIFNLLHPSNLGWWRHVLTDRIPRILLAVLIKWNEEASKIKAILLVLWSLRNPGQKVMFAKWKGKWESILQGSLKT